MKIALFTIPFPPQFGGIAQSVGNFYKMHENVFKRPPYLVCTFNPQLIWQYTKNIYRIKHPSLKITLRSIKYFIMFMKDVCKLVFFKAIKSGFYNLLKQMQWFFSPKNILRPLSACFYADLLLRGNFKPDILLVVSTRVMGIIAGIVKKKLNVPVITICHGEDIIKPNPETIFILHHSDGIITRTKAIKKLVLSKYDMKNKRFALIPDAILEKDYALNQSKEELRSELQIPANQFAITSIGNLVKRKNFDNVIKAVCKLKKTEKIDIDRPIHVFIIGDGAELGKIKALTNRLQMNDDVSFLGNISNELRNKYLKASDLFVMTPFDMPNSIEGFGIVYIEASYYQVPSIGSNSGGVPEAIIDGITGFIVKQKNSEELAKKIQVLYSDENLRQELGNKGRERILNKFMAPMIFDEYIHFLKASISEFKKNA